MNRVLNSQYKGDKRRRKRSTREVAGIVRYALFRKFSKSVNALAINKNASYRYRLVEVGRSRDAIMVEEFGRGTQCAKAGLLR
jgi:hypothetical protein